MNRNVVPDAAGGAPTLDFADERELRPSSISSHAGFKRATVSGRAGNRAHYSACPSSLRSTANAPISAVFMEPAARAFLYAASTSSFGAPALYARSSQCSRLSIFRLSLAVKRPFYCAVQQFQQFCVAQSDGRRLISRLAPEKSIQ